MRSDIPNLLRSVISSPSLHTLLEELGWNQRVGSTQKACHQLLPNFWQQWVTISKNWIPRDDQLSLRCPLGTSFARAPRHSLPPHPTIHGGSSNRSTLVTFEDHKMWLILTVILRLLVLSIARTLPCLLVLRSWAFSTTLPLAYCVVTCQFIFRLPACAVNNFLHEGPVNLHLASHSSWAETVGSVGLSCRRED